jgi:hypothetical protein
LYNRPDHVGGAADVALSRLEAFSMNTAIAALISARRWRASSGFLVAVLIRRGA